MRTRDLVCYFCMSDSCSLKSDRRGRPYLTCGACGARSFIVAWRDAVRSLALVQPLVAARAEEIQSDRAAATAAAGLESQVGAALRAMLQAQPDASAAPRGEVESARAVGTHR